MKKKTPCKLEGLNGDIRSSASDRLYASPDYIELMPFGGRVDLNDPMTYKDCEYRDYSIGELTSEIYKQIGYCKLYTCYFHPDWSESQKNEIEKMLFWYTKEYRAYLYSEDDQKARHWLKKWLFTFNNLIENMC